MNRSLIMRNRFYLTLDILFLAITPVIALSLRVSVPWDVRYNQALLLYTLLAFAIKFPVFYFFRLYRRFWRYASIDELILILGAVFSSTILVSGAYFGLFGSGIVLAPVLPRSVPLIEGLLTLLCVGGSRFSVRTYYYYVQTRDPKRKLKDKRVLIVGAGAAGEMVVRELRTGPLVDMEPVGFVDDSPVKTRAVIHGVPVLGKVASIPFLVKQHDINEVLIAMPTAPGNVIREAVKLCEEAEVSYKSVPGIFELINGRASITRIREVKIEDLLRREPVRIDTDRVEEMIAGKRVLVTGAGGSIGTELCLQISRFGPAQLIAVGHGENSLFNLSFELNQVSAANQVEKLDYKLVLADIRDRSRMEVVFSRFQPQIVFHAAAHKHVPLTEDNVEDAVTTNVLGTWNVVDLSRIHAVERFVLISTDKAVNPVNILGMTKRLAELIVRDVAVSIGKPFVSVRFGNVLGSRGSVVPHFQRQISEGGPVTVTHPEMRRFFMTIPEAVQLVLQAASLGKMSEVFVLDMGEPVKIVNLARDMIELSGCKVGTDIDIVYSGLRPGEKLYEELFTDDEVPERTKHEKIFVACQHIGPEMSHLKEQVDDVIRLAQAGSRKEARNLLAQIVVAENGSRKQAQDKFVLPKTG